MSMPVILEEAIRIPFRRRVTASVAVAIAWFLADFSPAKLRKALRFASRGAKPADAAQALRARQAVVAVSRRCAGQQCLQRSIATALLCRMWGTWPDWSTGVRTEPFRAHAWVAVDGEAIGESGDIRLFHTVMTVSAPRQGS